MRSLTLTALLSLFAPAAFASFTGDTSLSTVKAAFDNAGLPAALDINFNPTVLLEVTFPGPVYVHAGVQLTTTQTFPPPSFGIRILPPPLIAPPYVVIAVDPDAPVGVAEVRHFVGSDFTPGVPDVNLVEPLRNSTPACSNWVNPQPPAGDPAHRYTFLLYKQSPDFDKQTVLQCNSTALPIGFNVSSFAAATGLGDPIGGTFMLVAASS
ncbi:PEBP-like protein [Auriscalpium vulgare]|uniref:PEBP-like protein n=1 Tax=Auriscalpium vulgare TaxID=40419 RepID=A0ACB8RV21_9AGAM|nr:PEBP-like protein [Auriscalpium vulgare]